MGSIASTMPSRRRMPAPGRAVVRDLGVLVHRGADAVPDVLAHHREPGAAHHRLAGRAEVAEPGVDPDLVDRGVERARG